MDISNISWSICVPCRMKSSCRKPGLRVALEDQCPSIVPRLRKISYEGVVIWKEVAKHYRRNFKDTTCFYVLHHVIEANESTGILHEFAKKNAVPRSVFWNFQSSSLPKIYQVPFPLCFSSFKGCYVFDRRYFFVNEEFRCSTSGHWKWGVGWWCQRSISGVFESHSIHVPVIYPNIWWIEYIYGKCWYLIYIYSI